MSSSAASSNGSNPTWGLTRNRETSLSFDRRSELLAKLDEVGAKLRGEKSDADLRVMAARLAVELVGGDAGGLYLNRPRLRELELVVPPPQGGDLSAIVKHGA